VEGLGVMHTPRREDGAGWRRTPNQSKVRLLHELVYRFVYVNNTIVAMYVYIPKIYIAV
jgi:hypothetical protein